MTVALERPLRREVQDPFLTLICLRWRRSIGLAVDWLHPRPSLDPCHRIEGFSVECKRASVASARKQYSNEMTPVPLNDYKPGRDRGRAVFSSPNLSYVENVFRRRG
jgi:hypothetical protein